MDKSMIKGVVIGGISMVALSAGGVTGYRMLTEPKTADVVAVRDVTEAVTTPREVCENVQVRHRAPVQDTGRVAGTVIGGLAGGLLGSTLGGGNGRTLATVAGAAAGAYGGNQVQKSMQNGDVVTNTERRCKTVKDVSQKLVGYDVTYRLDGKEAVVRTAFKPGPTLPVKDGQVVTTAPNAKS
jgi:uncharacterized protein YcfJ